MTSSPATDRISEITAVAAQTLRVRGIVQGVGFRPTVWQLATRLGLTGSVLNDGEGVLVCVQGQPDSLTQFNDKLRSQCPPLATIENIEISEVAVDPALRDFRIVNSHHASNDTGVSPDAAICAECRNDIRDSGNRRFAYAFTNCTNCGPRLSIMDAIPYDRKNTSMEAFAQCTECLAQYSDPTDRRFHAQPNACPVCGPACWIENSSGIIHSRDVITDIAENIKQGKIVAIKGVGGFHLACDAGNAHAIATLRERKRRPDKALALMAKDVAQIRRYCKLEPCEKSALESSAAPIVLLEKRNLAILPNNIAPGLTHLGFMLPYSPLHVLLMDALDNPLVLTSGNVSDEPQCTGNSQAISRLSDIADLFLQHDRDILNRIDDSVLRKMDGEMRVLRRARGYAPAPLKLPDGFSQPQHILALGAELKNTFCIVRSGHAVLSQHMGDLQNAGTFADFEHNLKLYQTLFEFSPNVIAVDSHPDYLSSKLGRKLADERNLPVEEIRHHHAHVAACLAENQWPLEAGKVIGLALDGLGFGENGELWGGEILIADYRDYQRVACLAPVPMPGGVQAIRQPWRNTFAHLRRLDEWPQFASQNAHLPLLQMLGAKPLATLDAMIERKTNSPGTSSCGRLFDAVAGALGICTDRISFEGQAAITLEAMTDSALTSKVSAYPFEITGHSQKMIEPAPMWRALLDDLSNGVTPRIIAARFHKGLADILATLIGVVAIDNNINHVALSGGVFQNRILLELVSKNLRAKNLKVMQHRTVPANDGGIALGQAVIAAARLIPSRP